MQSLNHDLSDETGKPEGQQKGYETAESSLQKCFYRLWHQGTLYGKDLVASRQRDANSAKGATRRCGDKSKK